MLTDIDADMLDKGAEQLRSEGANVRTAICDVSSREQLETAAKHTLSEFGKVHVLVNNAGVAVSGPQEKVTEENWRWVIDVNIMGVVYGAQVFTPYLKQHGEGGHIINVASMAGLGGAPYAGPYCASKVAVVSLSESWFGEMKNDNIGVSVLCPAFVKSRIYDSMRNRQEQYGGPVHFEQIVERNPKAQKSADVVLNGIDTDIVGERVLEAIAKGELYIFTHPHYHVVAEKRQEFIGQAFERAEQCPTLSAVDRSQVITF